MISLSLAPPRPCAADRVVALVTAAQPYIASRLRRLELARNVASVLLADEREPWTTGAWSAHCRGVIREMVEHRVRHFGLEVVGMESCVRAMAERWGRGGEWMR